MKIELKNHANDHFESIMKLVTLHQFCVISAGLIRNNEISQI